MNWSVDETIPIYGDGLQVRDWLHIEDHINALLKVIEKGVIGKTYCIGGNATKTNLQVVEKICEILDQKKPLDFSYKELIKFVKDRPGHDKRYSIDASKISTELNWEPIYSFEEGLSKTVNWYINNLDWCKKIIHSSGYTGERIGL